MLPSKQNSIITLYTTFPLRHFERFKPSIHSWITNLADIAQFIFVLDSTDSLIDHASYSSDLQEFIEVNSLQLQSVPVFEDPCQLDSLNSGAAPSLKSLLKLMAIPKDGLVGFFNADLILRKDSDLKEYIIRSSTRLVEEIHFGHRVDCDSLLQNISLYEQGYDYFITSPTFLEILRYDRLSSERIGQLGWDYIFPLSIAYQNVFLAPTFDIFHVRHTTGSQKCWSSFIIDSVRKIDKSWLSNQKSRLPGITVKIMIEIYKYIEKKIPRMVPFASLVISRVIFYFFMKPLLMSMKKAG